MVVATAKAMMLMRYVMRMRMAMVTILKRVAVLATFSLSVAVPRVLIFSNTKR